MTTPTFTTPPPAPQTFAPTTFASLADAFIAWFATNNTEMTAAIAWILTQVSAVAASAAAALTSQNAAAASATAAAASAGITVWASATNYAQGARVISLVNFQPYISKTGGTNATDPSADPTHWAALFYLGIGATTKTGPYTAVGGDQYPQDTSGGGFTVTLPTSPSVNDPPIRVQDYAGTFASNNLILDPGTNNYRGAVQTCTCDIKNFAGLLIWTGVTRGWDWL